METNALEQLGLSKNEAKVYLTLLDKGLANSAQLARESGVHRINVYDVLNSLISKGLVSYVTENGVRCFKAESPEKLEKTLAGKLAALNEALPGLMSKFNSKKEQHDVSVMRGVEAKRSQFEEIARIARNTTYRVFIPHGLGYTFDEPYRGMIRKMFEKLAKQNVNSKLLVLDSPDARERTKIMFSGIPKLKIKFSDEIQFSPVSWNVCGSLLFITFFIDPFLVIKINSSEIERAFVDSFELMWKSVK